MSQQVGIVWNPSKVDGGELRAAFEAAAGANRDTSEADTSPAEAVWFETTIEDPGQGAAGDAVAAGCDLIIAAGGDGTVRSVASHLGESGHANVALGVVPLGTGNLLARNLGIPLGNPQAAFELALGGRAESIDLGQVRYTDAQGAEHDESFVVMAGFGIDAQMIVETNDDLKAKAGWLAYVESLGRAVAGTDLVDLKLTRGDDAPVEARAHTLIVANCGELQGGFTLVPDAQPNDGELDLLLLSAASVTDWLDTMRNMVWDNGVKRLLTRGTAAESSDSIAHERVTRVSVVLPTPLQFEIDGDDVGEVVQFDISLLPGALRVKLPVK